MKNDRLSNDKTSYMRKVQESKNVVQHVMDVNNYENIRVSRHEFGLLGGHIVNNSHPDIIDVESKLLGISNKIEYCVKKKTDMDDTNVQYLEPFQMLEYEQIEIKE